MRGMLITFEGIEGSGKSTQLALLARRLRRLRLPVTTTREPGGTAIGNKIRSLLLDIRNTDLHPKSELFLYLAGRAQHLHSVVRPALSRGTIILCDRFSDATIAYQGYGRKLRSRRFDQMVEEAADGLQPDLTLLLDLSPRVALTRVHSRRRLNRFDRETLPFHTSVRRGYRTLARRHPKRIVIIDGASDQAAVAEAITGVVLPRLARWRR